MDERFSFMKNYERKYQPIHISVSIDVLAPRAPIHHQVQGLPQGKPQLFKSSLDFSGFHYMIFLSGNVIQYGLRDLVWLLKVC